ncbi:MAG: PPC domain-containing protein [Bryobacteraceae bacterium]
MQTAGWDVLDNGSRLWRWSAQSPGAAGLRVHFTGFDAGGGRVWIHDGSGEQSEMHGPYSGRGIYGDGEFWSDFVLAETIVVEYEPEPGREAAGKPPFEVAALSHLLPGAVAGLPSTPTPLGILGGGTPDPGALAERLLGPLAGPRGAEAAPCHLDVSCFPEWATTARSVAHFVFEEDGNSFVCSGTVLNTRVPSGIPYFLTADHCVSSEIVARSVQAFFLYQTSECNGPPANRRDARRTLGARYLTGSGVARGDFSLLQLTSVPEDTEFSGWSIDELAPGGEAFGIHHPRGDYKRFSFGRRGATGRQLAGANPDFYYTVRYDGGLIEGGSSGSGLFREPGVLIGALSSGPKTETPDEACAIRPFPANYGRFRDMFPTLQRFLDPGNSGGTPSPQPNGGTPLVSGQPREFSIGPVTGPTLMTNSGFRIEVPQGGTRLDLRIATAGAGAEVEFWVRRDQAPAVVDGRVVADFHSPGRSGNEVLSITPQSSPALQPGIYFVTLALYTTNSTIRGTISATVTAAPSSTGNALVPGQTRRFSYGPVNNGTLFRGELGFTIQVPEGARVLEIELANDNADLDTDLYLRFGEDIGLADGAVISDHRSDGPNGRESISINQASQPPLRAGTYFIGVGLFARGVTVTGSITARITGGGSTTAPAPAGTVDLTSGVSRDIAIGPVATSVLLATPYRIQVPEGATRLEVKLSSSTPGVDLDLFGRFGSAPQVASGRVVSDYRSIGNAAEETIVITASSDPPLRAGAYFFSLGVFTTGTSIEASLLATVTTGDAPPPPTAGDEPRPLRSGVPAAFVLPAIEGGTLFVGGFGYYIDVPDNAARVEVRLNTDTSNSDVDLFVRHGAMPDVVDASVVTDFSGDGPTGSEVITITPTSSPALQPGRYFIALALFTPGKETRGSLTATVVASDPGTAAPGEPRRLTPGAPLKFALPAVDAPTLYTGDWGYTINVPEGVSRMEVRVRSAVPSVDVDAYVRRGAPVDIGDEDRVIADWASEGETGNENLNIVADPGQALTPGTYHLALALFTPGSPASGTVSVNLVTVSGARESIELSHPDALLTLGNVIGKEAAGGDTREMPAKAIVIEPAKDRAPAIRKSNPRKALRVRKAQ